MGIEKLQAMVIGERPIGEADRVVVFATPALGKVEGVARGSRRGRSRYAGNFQVFTRGELVIYRSSRRSLDSIGSFDPDDAVCDLRESLPGLARGCYLCELASLALVEDQPAASEYRMLVAAIDALRADPESPWVLSAFELQLGVLSGHGLPGQACRVCGSGSDQAPGWTLFPESGEGVCSACESSPQGGLRISRDERALLHALASVSMETLAGRFHSGKILPQPVARAARAHCLAWIGHEPRSLQFLRALTTTPGMA